MGKPSKCYNVGNYKITISLLQGIVPVTIDAHVTVMKDERKTSSASDLQIRGYLPADRAAVTQLLGFLPTLYPEGQQWLQRKLDEVEQRGASCVLAISGPAVGGILIDSPKGRRARKISTLFIAKTFENKGLGSRLFSNREARWLRAGIDQVHITVAACRLSTIEPFLIRKGFRLAATLPERYGPCRDEIVYQRAVG
jgi:GNAT superfamily N-acetyltransferase